MFRPVVNSKHRSILSGKTVRVIECNGDIVKVLTSEGGVTHVHIRDFNAEYRLVAQQKAVNR